MTEVQKQIYILTVSHQTGECDWWWNKKEMRIQQMASKDTIFKGINEEMQSLT